MIRRYMQFVKPYFGIIGLTILIGVLKFGIPLLIPLLVAYAIDSIILADGLANDERMTMLIQILLVFGVIFVVVRPPVEFFRQYLAQRTSNKILYDIRKKLYGHLQMLSAKFYSNNKVGEVISRVINDVEQTKDFIMTGLMNVWLDLVTIIIALVIMFNLNIELTFASMAIFPFYIFGVWYFFGRLRAKTRNRSQALAEVQGFLHERVQGINVVKSFAIEDNEEERFDKTNNNFLTKALDHSRWTAYSFMVVNTITDIGPLIVIGYGTFLVINGDLTVGVLAAFVAYLERLYGPLRRLVSSSTALTQSIASMDRVFNLFDVPYDVKDKENAQPISDVQGHIEIDNVSFKYDENDNNILENINLDIPVGKTVAFVGMSGGGKSSLVSLIPRFYDVTGGSIKIDGQDIRDVTVRSLRDNLGIVMQDNILFSDSIKENILLAEPDASEEEVILAAKRANAHEFIMNLENGYDTTVGERGVKLSGGQKQRIAIARVFLKNPPILILDEATSALDLESESIIQDTLDQLSTNRTTLVVAHRLSTVTHADKIVVIENGQITETGTHNELMIKDGSYKNLYDIQGL
ncbi:Putative multidrug export ATP-binding/permease protein [Jeotgalicoccus aerolatus]|uniref:ATP-binding cassette, subfamily B, MsbA n=1 Tax=Jeotgalicoccus aerolatus TaxID=709510 RepID=A0A1G8Y5H0_9STAP|nr:ABC transporter ATP-binding protein [Jeotgalicoccus aerolatus]MBP1952714.1 subfamily B ATP-binding cassette protein MsbA [Jeotgalicoccus aerolatus]NMA80641.1 ABC transporter ATP-binding protein [Jeotgalicoccus aerolatus]CAD2080916.1 Putative multidrug export ATP-binding/permease protein [Jeotgalicoccus aerolatus]SDJ98092.1 ATP-binding cassette, subfamily B, MsbA [Jeotgalicoccus aerolatus]GGE08732.1 putative multidrug export ATP-binding/permease protein [Jeotgalicoccus aerolatus]